MSNDRVSLFRSLGGKITLILVLVVIFSIGIETFLDLGNLKRICS